MIFEILVTSCLAGDPTDCGSGRIPVEGDLQACRAQARSIAANIPGTAVFQSYPCVEEGKLPEFNFSEVAPGVFVHKGRHAGDPDPQNRGDLRTSSPLVPGEFVELDFALQPDEIGDAVLTAIRHETSLPVGTVILTHMHPDHVLGVRPLLVDGAQVIGHANLTQALSARTAAYLQNMHRLGLEELTEANVVLPDVHVEDTTTIDLGDRELVLTAWPTGHTNNDLTVLDTATGTLVLGDLLFNGHTPALDGSALGWQQVMADLATVPAERAVPGHGPVAMAWPEGAAPLTTYLETLIGDTRAEIGAGASMLDALDRIGESQRKYWLLFDQFNKRNATVAFQELEWE